MSGKQRKDDKAPAKPEDERPTEIADEDLDPVAGGLRNVVDGVDRGIALPARRSSP